VVWERWFRGLEIFLFLAVGCGANCALRLSGNSSSHVTPADA